MLETYFKTEPIIVNIGLAGHPAPSLVSLMCENIAQGLTILVEDTFTGCVVGAAVNTHCVNGNLENLKQVAENCENVFERDIVNFYEYCSQSSNIFDRTGESIVFECAHVAVHPSHQYQNLGRRLIGESWILAQSLGYGLIRMDCSSRYSV
jgi:hypothetical protein